MRSDNAEPFSFRDLETGDTIRQEVKSCRERLLLAESREKELEDHGKSAYDVAFSWLGGAL